MPTLYKSILEIQPTDGDTVYIRRFTRDPPVLAIWNLTLQQFKLHVFAALTITGGTYDGSWNAVLFPNVAGTGLQGWGFFDGIVFIGVINTTGTTWEFAQTDSIANAYVSTTYATPPYPATKTGFTPIGSPSWSAPTTMTLAAPTSAPLIIPAYLVQKWRPQ